MENMSQERRRTVPCKEKYYTNGSFNIYLILSTRSGPFMFDNGDNDNDNDKDDKSREPTSYVSGLEESRFHILLHLILTRAW